MKREKRIVKQLLQKAKDAAMHAIEAYNKPATTFRTQSFIVNMHIAWTALFHAYFFKNGIKPYYLKNQSKSKGRRYQKVTYNLPDGSTLKDNKWWDLSQCLKSFFRNNTMNPVRKNLEFFIGLRNLIEHRSLPEIDIMVYGEAQANVLNFNEFLIDHFGEDHRLDYMLTFSIQLFRNPDNILQAMQKELTKKDSENVLSYINSFRSALASAVFNDPQFAFKAALIQVKNHPGKDTLALKFISEKDLTPEQLESLENAGIVLIKEKEKMVDGVPPNFKLDYRQLISRLRKEIPGIKINSYFHQIRKKIMEEKPELYYNRFLNPNNPNKSMKKTFYDPKIIEEIKKYYSKPH